MIKSLHLKNFKCFADQSFELKNLTLLTGLNNTGKSSVIQSLLLLRQSYQDLYLKNGKLLLSGDLIDLGTTAEVFCNKAPAGANKFGFNLDFAGGLNAEWYFEYDKATPTNVAQQSSMKAPNPAVYNTSLFEDNFYYLPADRIGPQATFEMSHHAVSARQQLGVTGEYTPHFLQEFGDNTVISSLRHDKRSTHPRLSDQVDGWMGEISPGVSVRQKPYTEINMINLLYNFSQPGLPTEDYRSTNVGFGITYTLPIVVALLASEEDTLVLLENPEAHLHPRGQVKLGELMARAASCGIQVIVETHSEYILKGIQIALGGVLKPVDPIIKPDQVRLFHLSRAGTLQSKVDQYDTNQTSWHNLIRELLW